MGSVAISLASAITLYLFCTKVKRRKGQIINYGESYLPRFCNRNIVRWWRRRHRRNSGIKRLRPVLRIRPTRSGLVDARVWRVRYGGIQRFLYGVLTNSTAEDTRARICRMPPETKNATFFPPPSLFLSNFRAPCAMHFIISSYLERIYPRT